MASVSRYGRDIGTVFDLLGIHEPALTDTLGWTIGRSSTHVAALLGRLDLVLRVDNTDGYHNESEAPAVRVWFVADSG
jgi:hypothetical protein